jgi:transposase
MRRQGRRTRRMSEVVPSPCPGCQRLQAQVEALTLQVQALHATVAHLQEQLAAARKDSSTSSKPPSSDIVKPPKHAQQTHRSAGGQPGHPKHDRAPFAPEQVNLFAEHSLHACPTCGGPLRRNGSLARVVQQVDIDRPPLTVAQHTSPEYWCARCAKSYQASQPAHVEAGGLLGPRLTALVAYLKGVCHASYSTVRKFLRDVVGLTISRGQLAKVLAKVSAALDGPYQELLDVLPIQDVLNVDETGHKDRGVPLWTWCFRAELFTLFKIEPTRSADVLLEVLGEEFDGVLGCDCFSAYRRYMRVCNVVVQFCLAHLIRDVKFLLMLPGRRDQAYGQRLCDALRALFGVIHQRGQIPASGFGVRLAAARDEVLRVGTQDVPDSRHAQRMAKRLRTYGASYFTFVTTPEIEPTNNLAEQAIRFVVIDRHITQGTRGPTGQRWCERIWTVLASCLQQGQDVWGYLEAAVRAHWLGQPVPTLLPEES